MPPSPRSTCSTTTTSTTSSGAWPTSAGSPDTPTSSTDHSSTVEHPCSSRVLPIIQVLISKKPSSCITENRFYYVYDKIKLFLIHIFCLLFRILCTASFNCRFACMRDLDKTLVTFYLCKISPLSLFMRH